MKEQFLSKIQKLKIKKDLKEIEEGDIILVEYRMPLGEIRNFVGFFHQSHDFIDKLFGNFYFADYHNILRLEGGAGRSKYFRIKRVISIKKLE